MEKAEKSEEGGVPSGACAGCGASLKTRALVAQEKLWHPRCLRCGRCQERLKAGASFFREMEEKEGGSVGEKEEILVCKVCKTREEAGCPGCGRAVSGLHCRKGFGLVVPGAGNCGRWHPRCLLCPLCQGPFGQPFLFRPAPQGQFQGQPLHPACWHFARLHDNVKVGNDPFQRHQHPSL